MTKLTKKPFIFLLLSVCLSILSLETNASQVVDKVVAQVNDTLITQSDVSEALRNLEKNLEFIQNPVERSLKRTAYKKDIINALIDEKILENEMDRQNIVVSEDDVTAALNNMASQHQTTLDGLKARMAEQGVVFSEYKERLRNDLKKNEFMKKVIYPKLRIADYDLEQYYKRHPDEFTGYANIRFLEILLTTESPSDGLSVDQLANKIAGDLRRGGNFKSLAQKYSRGPFAANGGDSGLLEASQMRPDLVNLLINLNTGEISDPITTPNGILIFKLLDKKNRVSRPFNEVKEMVRQKLGPLRVQEELENFVREARSRAFVEIKP